jgi:hypothetical protein
MDEFRQIFVYKTMDFIIRTWRKTSNALQWVNIQTKFRVTFRFNLKLIDNIKSLMLEINVLLNTNFSWCIKKRS